MKLKGIITTLALSLTLGLGVGVGLAAQENPAEAKAAGAGDTLYLKVNDNWSAGNADFAAYFYNGSSDPVWVNMALESGSTQLYSVTVPSTGGYAGVIFGRMNPDRPGKVNNFYDGVCWNKTVDITLSGGDYYLMYDDSYDTGIWYTGNENVYVKGNFNGSGWAEDDLYKLTWNRLTGQYDFIDFNYLSKDNVFKIFNASRGQGQQWVGYSSSIAPTGLFVEAESDNNIKVNTTITSYDIYYKPQHHSIWIEKNATLAATEWAQAFNTAMEGVCGTSDPEWSNNHASALNSIWATHKSSFEALTRGAKDVIDVGTANADVAQAKSCYVHIMERYGPDSSSDIKLDEFAGGPNYNETVRTPTRFDSNSYDNTTVIIIIAAAAFALAATGCFFFMRKKEDR